MATAWRRIGIAVLFTVVPALSFAIADGVLAPEWQNPTERWNAVFATEARAPLETALLAVFGTGTAIVVLRPTLRLHPIGRAALVGAGVMAGFYAIALAVASDGVALLLFASAAVLVLAMWILAQVVRMAARWTSARGLGLTPWVILAMAVSLGFAFTDPLQELALAAAIWILVSVVGAAPLVCVAVVVRLVCSRWDGWTAAKLLPSAASAGVATGSIYATWQRAMDHYATLSRVEPFADCYVASAAATGHPRLVASWAIPNAGGTTLVTPQLVRLKAVELLVLSASPTLHRRIRCIYDRLGPRLARRLTTPLRADLAWISILPLDVLARLILAASPRAARERAAALMGPRCRHIDLPEYRSSR